MNKKQGNFVKNKQKVMGREMPYSSQEVYLKINTKCIGRVYRPDNMADQDHESTG